jgi:hypothetical protein
MCLIIKKTVNYDLIRKDSVCRNFKPAMIIYPALPNNLYVNITIQRNLFVLKYSQGLKIAQGTRKNGVNV